MLLYIVAWFPLVSETCSVPGFSFQYGYRAAKVLLALVLYHASTMDFIPIALSLGSSNPLLRTPSPCPRRDVRSWAYVEDDEMDDEEMVQHFSHLKGILSWYHRHPRAFRSRIFFVPQKMAVKTNQLLGR